MGHGPPRGDRIGRPGATPVAGAATNSGPPRERCLVNRRSAPTHCGPFSSPGGRCWPTTASAMAPGPCRGRASPPWPVSPGPPNSWVLMLGPSTVSLGDPPLTALALAQCHLGIGNCPSRLFLVPAREQGLPTTFGVPPAGATRRGPLCLPSLQPRSEPLKPPVSCCRMQRLLDQRDATRMQLLWPNTGSVARAVDLRFRLRSPSSWCCVTVWSWDLPDEASRRAEKLTPGHSDLRPQPAGWAQPQLCGPLGPSQPPSGSGPPIR